MISNSAIKEISIILQNCLKSVSSKKNSIFVYDTSCFEVQRRWVTGKRRRRVEFGRISAEEILSEGEQRYVSLVDRARANRPFCTFDIRAAVMIDCYNDRQISRKGNYGVLTDTESRLKCDATARRKVYIISYWFVSSFAMANNLATILTFFLRRFLILVANRTVLIKYYKQDKMRTYLAAILSLPKWYFELDELKWMLRIITL